MALETSGFQLSQFDRAPQIPGNIGVVDTKSIYGAVVDALKTNEALRTTQQVQAMNDAETALATQKARTEMGLLTPEAEARQAKAQLFTAGAPYQQALLPFEDRARRQELEAQEIKNRLLSEPGTARKVLERSLMTQAEITKQRNLDVLSDPLSTTDAKRAAAIGLGFEAKAVQPGFGYAVVTGQDGAQRLVITSKNAPGAYDIGSGTGVGAFSGGLPPAQLPLFRSATSTPSVQLPLLPQRTPAPAAAVAPSAPPAAATEVAPLVPVETTAPTSGGLTLTPAPAPNKIWLGPSVADKATQTEIAQAKGKALEQLPKLKSTLQDMELSVQQGEKYLDLAKDKISTWNPTILGSLWRAVEGLVPGTEVNDVKNQLLPVESNIFVQQLSNMRQNSPTGGAVGNVTDVEGQRLINSLGSLSLTQSRDQLLANIENVKTVRRQVFENLKKTVGEYENFLGPMAPQTSAQPDINVLVKMYGSKK